MSLYQQLLDANVPLDSHESDLYALATREAADIIKASGHCYSLFISQIDGKRWFDLPFAYTPFWEGKPRSFDKAAK